MFYKKGDFTIGTVCYNAMIQTLRMKQEEIEKIDVTTIINTLNSN